MRKRFSGILCIVIITTLLLSTFKMPGLVLAQPFELPGETRDVFQPVVEPAVHHDVSQPMWEASKPADPLKDGSTREPSEVVPALKLPKTENRGGKSSTLAEPLPQSPVAADMPLPLAGFEGVSNVNGVLPPDTNGDIGYDPVTGKKWYFQWVNMSFNIWDVTNPDSPIQYFSSPRSGNSIWTGFGGKCEFTNDGDPIILFDQLANRWLASQFSVDGPFYQCIAISKTADPTGAWYRYAFKVHDTKMNDYPKLGVWPDGYYMSVNQFLGTSWAGAGVFVFERDKMLQGSDARFVYFDLYSINVNFGGMLPADADGNTPPPPNSPAIFAEWDDGSWFGSSDALRLWEFHVDWANPAASTFGVNGQPNLLLPTTNVNPLPLGSSSKSIPQPGTSNRLDNLADRIMHRLQYWNYGTYQSMVTNHAVDAGGSRAGIHWMELRKSTGNWLIQNQGVHAPADGLHRWMGSAAMDGSRNLALGYSLSSSTIYPSIAYAGRLVTDPANSLPQAEVTLKTGAGSQTHSSGRWGDYTMMSVDPRDNCTFWYTNQFYASTSSGGWRTWIGAFKFPTCTTTQFGTLSGAVKVAGSETPIGGAKVTINALDAYSGADGAYSITVPVGTYSARASAIGYHAQTVNNVTITNNAITPLDFILTPASLVTVQGKVSDSGHNGMPLYARIEIGGYPGSPIFTNPFTGQYSVQLYEGTIYPFTVSAVQGGFGAPQSHMVNPATTPTQNFQLTVDPITCNALGYRMINGLIEHFESGAIPAGWTVVDHQGNGQVWQFDDPGAWGNLTGGSGLFASVDSDTYGLNGLQDTSLVSPSLDFSGFGSIDLHFKTNFTHNNNEIADVDYSNDGGVTWVNLWRRVVNDEGSFSITFSPGGKKSDIRFRFHYYNAAYDWFWQIDEVVIGTPVCQALNGGMVGGYITDANTGGALNGATILGGYDAVSSFATPLDQALNDGFYLTFAPSGSITLKAAQVGGYQDITQPVSVPVNDTVQRDFSLPAGRLSFAPSTYNVAVKFGQVAVGSVTLQNSGSLPAAFTLVESLGLPLAPQVTGPFAQPMRRTSPKQLDALTAEGVRLYEPPQVPLWQGSNLIQRWNSELKSPWGVGITPEGQVWLSSSAQGGGDDLLHLYAASGAPNGATIPTQTWVNSFAADLAYDLMRGVFWQVDVGGEGCIHEMDSQSAAFTGVKICPQTAHALRGLALDAHSRTFYGGSWVDGIIYHFDEQGQVLDSVSTGLNLAGMAVNPTTGHLFILSNASVGYDVYVVDVRRGYQVLGGFDLEGMTDFGQGGLELDDQGNLWAVDQKSGDVFQFASGEQNPTAFADVGWLTVAPMQGNLAVMTSTPIQVTVDARTLTPGMHYAHVMVNENTPYSPVPLTIAVQVEGYKYIFPLIYK